MKTTYYYGDIEFGTFAPSDIATASSPLAIIHNINLVKEFDTPEQAWQFYVDSDGAHESYVSVDATNQHGVQYQLVFQKHA